MTTKRYIANTDKLKAYVLEDAPALDSIFVFMYDIEPGKGRLIVECWGKAWSTFWGAMHANGSPAHLQAFLQVADVDYITGKLMPTKKDEKYLRRIVSAIKETL